MLLNEFGPGGTMEVIYYRCETCGFIHQVPAYWADFNPDQSMEMPHLNLETKLMCTDLDLKLFSREDT